jgi:hypothetical protein
MSPPPHYKPLHVRDDYDGSSESGDVALPENFSSRDAYESKVRRVLFALASTVIMFVFGASCFLWGKHVGSQLANADWFCESSSAYPQIPTLTTLISATGHDR